MKNVTLILTFKGVDLCLNCQLVCRGMSSTLDAELNYNKSASKGKNELLEKTARAHRELLNLRTKWGNVSSNDPIYNCNLNRDRAPNEALAMSPFQKARA